MKTKGYQMVLGGNRPAPQLSIFEDPAAPIFIPAPDLIEWCQDTFIADGAPFQNEDQRQLA